MFRILKKPKLQEKISISKNTTCFLNCYKCTAKRNTPKLGQLLRELFLGIFHFPIHIRKHYDLGQPNKEKNMWEQEAKDCESHRTVSLPELEPIKRTMNRKCSTA